MAHGMAGVGRHQALITTAPGAAGYADPDTGESLVPERRAPKDGAALVHDTSGDRSLGDVTDRPCPTVTVGVNSVNAMHCRVTGAEGPDADPETGERITIPARPADKDRYRYPTEERKFTLAELRRICAFPDDFALTGSYAQGWERLGRAVPPLMMSHIAATVRDRILNPIRERNTP
jgi:DNA (cytosine-5)-methyltransferase 1